MTFVILLLLLAGTLLLASLWTLARDSRGAARPPASHAEDPRFRAPSGR